MAYSIAIDIHGETRQSGRKLLENKLKSLPKDTREIVVRKYFATNGERL